MLAQGHSVMGDGAFTGTEDFPVDKPFTKPQLETNPALTVYNDALAKYRNIVERVNGIVKMQFKILRQLYPYHPLTFPAVFRLCCLLTNRYFRLYGFPGSL